MSILVGLTPKAGVKVDLKVEEVTTSLTNLSSIVRV